MGPLLRFRLTAMAAAQTSIVANLMPPPPVVLPGLGELKTWQLAFLIVSVPGPLLALVLLIQTALLGLLIVGILPPLREFAVGAQRRLAGFVGDAMGYAFCFTASAFWIACSVTLPQMKARFQTCFFCFT